MSRQDIQRDDDRKLQTWKKQLYRYKKNQTSPITTNQAKSTLRHIQLESPTLKTKWTHETASTKE